MYKLKERIQNKELLKYKNEFLIILEWATGVGKSLGSLKLVKKLTPKSLLILVAEEAHKENWRVEITKFSELFKYDFNIEINIECYASIKKHKDTNYDIIILDEGHHVSELRASFLETITCNNIIVLSATIDSEELDRIKQATKSLDSVFHSSISLQEAIKLKVIPEPDIYLIPLELNTKDKKCFIIESRGNKKDRVNITCDYADRWTYKKDKNKYPAYELKIVCTEYQKNEYYDQNIEFFKNSYIRSGNKALYNKWMRLGNERKIFLGELKTNSVQILINKLGKKRFICFCTSILQADLLSNFNAVHSKNKESKEILKNFYDKVINYLFCVGMLTEGQNIPDIDLGIIVQLDGKERPFIQKHGRVLRSKNPAQFIFYFKDTRDEEYLTNIISNIDKNYIQIINKLNLFNYE